MPVSPKTTRNSAQCTLLGLLSRSLFGTDYAPESTLALGDVWRESLLQAVSLTAFAGRAAEVLPHEVRDHVKPVLRRYILQNSRIFAEHTHLDAVLTAAGVRYCIIKGTASAVYYPEPFLRGMGDVDFFVNADDLARAEAALSDAGFTVQKTDSSYHILLEYRGVKFEMHYELPGVPQGDIREAVIAQREDLLNTAHRLSRPTMTCMLPDAFHHGFILLLHTQQHLLTEGIGLRHLSDWAVFVASMTPDAFVQVFRERLASVGLWRFACLISLAASRALGLPYAPWMGDEMSDGPYADALLDDFLAGGNFGVKDPGRDRVYEGMLITNHTRGNVGRSRFRNGLASLNTWVRNRWPLARKCPLLLPFGWVFFALRRAVLVLTGQKKRIPLRRTLRGSQERQKLYEAMRLFEPER